MMYIVDIIFFFKQKTAYEMRISDWSSDVCSSDLPTYIRCAAQGNHSAMTQRGNPLGQRRVAHEQALEAAAHAARNTECTHFVGQGDRKSVVSGKSVSVRVDLGGRRIIKKKNIHHIISIIIFFIEQDLSSSL